MIGGEATASSHRLAASTEKTKRRRRSPNGRAEEEKLPKKSAKCEELEVRNVESEIRTLKSLIPGLSEERHIGEVSPQVVPTP